MSCFEQNMALLMKNAPGLAKRVQEVEAAKEVNLPPFSTSFIKHEANLEHINTLAVLGFGNGEHIKELVAKTLEKTFILVLDHDLPTFKAVLSCQDLSPILTSPRVDLSIGEDPNSAVRFRIDNFYKVNTIPDIIIAEYKPSVSKNPQYYEQVKKYLQEASMIATQNLSTLNESSDLWQKQILENAATIVKCPGLGSLFGRFVSQPAIIVCAGPSLDKNVEQLKHAMGKAIIICVDTAIRTLANHGIKPDFIMTIDAVERNYKYYLEGIDNEGIYLIAGPAVYPRAISSFAPRVFISGFGHPLFLWLEAFIGARGSVKLGGSVSTACFDLAKRLGANPLVLIGQDLSFTDNRFYTDGVSQERINEVEEWLKTQELVEVEDIYGQIITTTRNAWTWIKWFEYQISECPDILCIDATEGGAKIPGTKIMALKEVIDQYCQSPLPIAQTIEEASRGCFYYSLVNLVEEMDVLIKDWDKVERICCQGEALSEKLLGIITSKGVDKRANKLFKEIGILYQRVVAHRGLMRIGGWNLEFLLYLLEKARPSPEPVVKARSCLEFFKGVGKYCRTSVPDFKKAQQELWQTENKAGNQRINPVISSLPVSKEGLWKLVHPGGNRRR